MPRGMPRPETWEHLEARLGFAPWRDPDYTECRCYRWFKWREGRTQSNTGDFLCPECWLHLKTSRMEEVAGRRKRHMLRNGGSHTRAEWLELQRLYDSRCWVPGCDQPGASKDHYIPVSKGGTDDIANIRPCCRRHNSMKSNKMPEEFLERLQFNNQEVQSWATR